MSARSEHLDESIGMLVCYGKQYKEEDEDCSSCPLSGDCETLTDLRRVHRKKSHVAKIRPTNYKFVEEEEEEQEEEQGEEIPWAQPQEVVIPPHWQQPSQPQYIAPRPQNAIQFQPPGMHCSAQMIPHPAPHLTYMVSNPVDCPMPIVGETWYSRMGKNVLSGVLSEAGRQFYEYFRRFRF